MTWPHGKVAERSPWSIFDFKTKMGTKSEKAEIPEKKTETPKENQTSQAPAEKKNIL